MINVKAPGGSYTPAQGNGCTDDTTALQALIDAKLGALYFPPGRYLIRSTLFFRPKTGYHVIGSGMSEKTGSTIVGQSPECALVWDGPADGTMVKCQGEGLVWNGLSLWGTNPGATSPSSCPTTGGRPDVGILIEDPSDSPLAAAGKIWFASLIVDDCDVAVATASGTFIANEVAFGFFWPRNCGTGLYLQNANSVGFTFEYVHAESVSYLFLVTGGGRIFTQSCRIVSSNTTVLFVLGGGDNEAFYHINGLAFDDGATGCTLVTDQDLGSGKHVFRFTNAHFVCTDTSDCPPLTTIRVGTPCRAVSATIDRSGSASGGQSMLELVGCRGVAALNANITLKGRSSGERSHLIVRESEVRSATQLIKSGSSNYTLKGVENYTFGCGIVPDDAQTV